MSTEFLHKSRRAFYCRVQIPKKIRQHFKGKVEVWRSLKTGDKDLASLRSAQFDASTRRLFMALKRHGERMTKEHIEALVGAWLELELDEAEDARTLGGRVSEEDREGIYLALSDQFDAAHEALVTNNYRTVQREADDLMKTAGLSPLDHGGVEFGRLCRRLLQAKQEFLRIEADRWEGEYRNHRPAVSPAVPLKVSAPSSSQIPLFSVVVDKYFAEHPRPDRIAKPLRIEYQKFVETIGGDKPIGAITKADARLYKENLLTVRKLAALTVVKHFASLNVLFNWASSQGFVEDGYNPVKGVAPSKKVARKQMKGRRPFTDEELLKVFGSQEYLKQRNSNPARYWLPLICLFSVCRRDEAGQLTLADIQEADGIPFFRITDEGPEQALKNEGSRRRVPVHSSLLKLGFMEYVKSIRAQGHLRLFPQLKRKANGFSDAVGKFFSRCVTKAGLHDPALVLHSLRHGGITKLHGAGCPHSTVELLAGHASGNVHGQYVHREQLPLALLQEGLERLRYDDVVKALHLPPSTH